MCCCIVLCSLHVVVCCYVLWYCDALCCMLTCVVMVYCKLVCVLICGVPV